MSDGYLDAVVADSVNCGGGVSFHAEYVVQVSLGESRWIIFRRYSSFYNLYRYLCTAFGGREALRTLGILFPEKSYMGSILSAEKGVTESRKVVLNHFLSSFLRSPEFTSLEEVQRFLDVDGQGLSGLRREFGSERVLRQGYCSVKLKLRTLEPLLWARCFVVLTSDGMLFILPSVYDRSSQAFITWNVPRYGTIVQASASSSNTNNQIHISSSQCSQTVKLSFTSAMDSAFWIRVLCDFASLEQTNHPHSARPKANEVGAQTTRVENVYSKGTGHHVDELSSGFGI